MLITRTLNSSEKASSHQIIMIYLNAIFRKWYLSSLFCIKAASSEINFPIYAKNWTFIHGLTEWTGHSSYCSLGFLFSSDLWILIILLSVSLSGIVHLMLSNVYISKYVKWGFYIIVQFSCDFDWKTTLFIYLFQTSASAVIIRQRQRFCRLYVIVT